MADPQQQSAQPIPPPPPGFTQPVGGGSNIPPPPPGFTQPVQANPGSTPPPPPGFTQAVGSSAQDDDKKPGAINYAVGVVDTALDDVGKTAGGLFDLADRTVRYHPDAATTEQRLQEQDDRKKAIYKQSADDFHTGHYYRAVSNLVSLFDPKDDDPNDPLAQMMKAQWDSSNVARQRMVEAAETGHYGAMVQHAAGMLPIASQVDAAMENFSKDRSRENLAHLITAALPAFVPALVKGVSRLGASSLEETAAANVPKAAVTDTAAATTSKGAELKPAGESIASEAGAAKQPSTTYPRNAGEVQTAIADNAGKKAEGLAKAGERVQTEAQTVKKTKGQEVGAAKEDLAKSLPQHLKTDDQYTDQALKEAQSAPDRGFAKNPYSGKEFDELDPDQQTHVAQRAAQMKSAETGQIPFPKNGNAVQNVKAIADELGEEKLGLKDPNSPLGKLSNRLTSGKNPDGTDLSFSFEDAQNSRKALNSAIKTEYSKFQAGGDGTLYNRLVGLKHAFDEDLYDTWEQYGDAAQAQKVRQLGREYSGIVSDQYMGPAKTIFKTNSPEKIVSGIVSGGARSQSAVESILKNTASAEGREVLRDSVEREIYRRATKADGTIDAAKALSTLSKMGDTGKLIFGDAQEGMTTFLTDAAKKQAETGESILSASDLENPEQIIHGIVSGGAKSQSKVESLVKQLSADSREVLGDSALKEIYRRNTLPNGDIDMAAAHDEFQKMGQTGKALFGDKHAEISDFLDAAMKQQETKQLAANKVPLYKRLATKASRIIGAGAGAYIGGPVGAMGGSELAGEGADAIFQAGKSGAVKVGISPNEQVVLSPAQVIKQRPRLTAFLKAVGSNDNAAITATYYALKTPTEDQSSER